MESPRIRRALISVSDKLGLAGFAGGWPRRGSKSIAPAAPGSTWKARASPVRDVSEYTGFPEMMEGRLKTLHPKVHGGILCRHDNPEDMESAWPSTASSPSSWWW